MPKIDGSTFKSAIYVEDANDVRRKVLTEDSNSEDVAFDNTATGLTSDNVQDAIAELKTLIDAL